MVLCMIYHPVSHTDLLKSIYTKKCYTIEACSSLSFCCNVHWQTMYFSEKRAPAFSSNARTIGQYSWCDFVVHTTKSINFNRPVHTVCYSNALLVDAWIHACPC